MGNQNISKWYFKMVKYRLLAAITFGPKKSNFKNKCNKIRSAFMLGLSSKGLIELRTSVVDVGSFEDRLQQMEREFYLLEEKVRKLEEVNTSIIKNQVTVDEELHDLKLSLAVACRSMVQGSEKK